MEVGSAQQMPLGASASRGVAGISASPSSAKFHKAVSLQADLLPAEPCPPEVSLSREPGLDCAPLGCQVVRLPELEASGFHRDRESCTQGPQAGPVKCRPTVGCAAATATAASWPGLAQAGAAIAVPAGVAVWTWRCPSWWELSRASPGAVVCGGTPPHGGRGRRNK